MLEMYKMRLGMQGANVGAVVKHQSDQIMNQTFKSDVGYRRAKLYNQKREFLEEVDIKFKKHLSYALSGDYVDFLVQFRPLYHPEKKFPLYETDLDETGKVINERVGFYIDIPEDDGEINTWLIVGKSEDLQFVTYNVLKCNWTARWIKNNVIYECLGVIRDRNNYNSGEWSDGFITSVEDQSQFWLPTTEKTQTIVHNDRFIVADRENDPPTFHVSKITDLHPIGITKFTLAQEHFNPHTDNAKLKICDYYEYNSQPVNEADLVSYMKLELNSNKLTLPLGSSKKTITAKSYDAEGTEVETTVPIIWSISSEASFDSELEEIFEVSETSSTFSINIPKKDTNYKYIGSVITVTATAGTNEVSIDLEVTPR